jgi:pimeloyl-ACP methyl ester carboxylesterase
MRSTGTDLKIKANGIEISYDDLGAGALPVIFIHGFPFNKSSWQPQLDAMQEHFRVIAYDNRGFGQSQAGDEKLTVTLMANDLIKLMDSLEIDKAIICGLSMGGYIVLNAVTRFPDRFTAFVLCDTQCVSDTPEGAKKRYETAENIQKDGKEKFAEGFIGKLFAKETRATNASVQESITNMITTTSVPTLVAALDALAQRTETCTELKNVARPSLIICGEEDGITPPSQSEMMHKNLSGSEMVIIPNAGHLSNLEQPALFNEILHNYLIKLTTAI